MNQTATEEAQSLLVFANLRLLSLRDWIDRHPIPTQDWIINLTLHPKTIEGHEALGLRIAFTSYKAACDWGHKYAQFLYDDRGWAARETHETFLSIPMSDFTLTLAFPESTHPRFFPALAGTGGALNGNQIQESKVS